MVESHEAHLELTNGPRDLLGFPKLGSSWDQVQDRCLGAPPSVLTVCETDPAVCKKSAFQLCEFVKVQGDGEIDVSGTRNGPDDYKLRSEGRTMVLAVWIIDTPTNRAVAQKIWAADPNRSHLDGITTFKTADASSPETALIEQLDTIDLHHGAYSANPPYTVLEIIGTAISERTKTELSQFGFDQFQETPEGFRAVRQLPTDR